MISHFSILNSFETSGLHYFTILDAGFFRNFSTRLFLHQAIQRIKDNLNGYGSSTSITSVSCHDLGGPLLQSSLHSCHLGIQPIFTSHNITTSLAHGQLLPLFAFMCKFLYIATRIMMNGLHSSYDTSFFSCRDFQSLHRFFCMPWLSFVHGIGPTFFSTLLCFSLSSHRLLHKLKWHVPSIHALKFHGTF